MDSHFGVFLETPDIQQYPQETHIFHHNFPPPSGSRIQWESDSKIFNISDCFVSFVQHHHALNFCLKWPFLGGEAYNFCSTPPSGLDIILQALPLLTDLKLGYGAPINGLING